MADRQGIAIINPRAGGYATKIEWPTISRHLKKKGIVFDQAFTTGAGNAIDLAREAADEEYRYIVAVGGDGTINEVANGILGSANPDRVIMGVVSTGTTCSFARSIGVPRNFGKYCDLIAGGRSQPIDVGLVEYTREGQRLRRYFVNEADIGFGATVVEAAKKYKNYLGRSINYLPHVVGGLASLVSYNNMRLTVRLDDEPEDIDDCAMVVVANGTHFGGGMQMAPDARPDDGRLDVVIFANMGKSELLKVWPMTYRGRHVDNDKVRLLKVEKVDIECDETILVEADGELLGEGPISFSVVPGALNIVV